MERQYDSGEIAITEAALPGLFSQFKRYIASKNIPEIKKFVGSYVDKIIIFNEIVEVIFRFESGGITLDGNNLDVLAATVGKKELFETKRDAV